MRFGSLRMVPGSICQAGRPHCGGGGRIRRRHRPLLVSAPRDDGGWVRGQSRCPRAQGPRCCNRGLRPRHGQDGAGCSDVYFWGGASSSRAKPIQTPALKTTPTHKHNAAVPIQTPALVHRTRHCAAWRPPLRQHGLCVSREKTTLHLCRRHKGLHILGDWWP